MRKIIKRKIQISTHKRDLIDFINDEFYSHDKHNAFLEFTMKSLPTDNIIALFYFQKTKRYVETKAFVDGDKFTIEFDTSLITADETVLGFIYFEKVAQSADVHRFSFGVKVSEIDKLHDIPIQEQTTKRVVAIEDIVTKAELDELFKRIEKNGGTYNDTEIRSSLSSIEERVHTLEAKQDKDTVYDDSDVKSRLSALESNLSRYLTEHQPLTSIEERIQQVEARFNNLSNIYLSSHQSLEHLATKDALSAVEQRVQKLEAIDVTSFATNTKVEAVEQRVQTLENKPAVDLSHVVTKEELENKHYIQDVSNLATNEKVTAVENRVQALETNTSEFARKSEIPQPYNDNALTERVSLLEAKAIANGAYDDKPLLDKIHAIEEKSNAAITAHQSLEHLVTRDELDEKHYLTNVPEEYAKKSDLSDLATNTKVETVENRVQVLENKSVVTHEELEQAGYAKTTELSNLATNAKVESVESRVQTLENKPNVDLSHLVTKDELEGKHYISNQELEGKGYINDVSGLATKQELEAAKASIPQPYNDTEIRGQLARKVDTDTLATLATKQELQTNDEEVKRRLTTLEGKTDNFITGVSVNKEGSNVTLTYNYVDGQSKNVSFTDSDTINVAYDDSDLRNRVVALETKEDKDTKYDDTEVKRRLTELESKPTVDTSVFVTEEKLNSKGYITDISRLATKEELANMVTNDGLEAKHYVTEEQLNNKAYLTQQNLDNYALKSELPQPYNDGPLNERVTALENKPTTHFVTKQELEDKHYLNDISNLATKLELQDKVNKSDFDTLKSDVVKHDELSGLHYLTETIASETYAKKSELPTPYNDSALVNRISALESKQDNDTVYNDTEVKQRLTNLESRPQVDVTKLVSKDELPNLIPHQSLENYALKSELYNDRELKERVTSLEKSKATGGSSKQDTGWITIKDGTDTFGQIVKIRRIYNMVHVRIDSTSDTGMTINFSKNIELATYSLPETGFNTPTDVIVPITQSLYHISNNSGHSNLEGLAMIQVKNGNFTMTVDSYYHSGEVAEMHINSVSYFTDDPFPFLDG